MRISEYPNAGSISPSDIFVMVGTHSGTLETFSVTGTDVLNFTGSVADSAMSVAVVALETAWAGTAAASAAYTLAVAGTVIPPLSTLPDVSIPAPSPNQVLVFDGSQWIAEDPPAPVAPSAFTYYTDNVASGTLSFFDLTTSPSGQPEHQGVITVGGGTNYVAGRSFLSPPLDRTSVSAGAWQFNTFAQVANASRPFQVITDVYLRTISGLQTYLFSGTSSMVNTLAITQFPTFVTHGSFACDPTDRLVFGYAALRTANPASTVYLYTSGTNHDSNIITPLGYAHNDLAGIQGGATDERYHVTYDQNQALLGTSGHPSSTNPYVTNASLASFATGDGRTLMLCSAYTPVLTGPDVAQVPVPYDSSNGTTSVVYHVRRLGLRVETAGSASTVVIEKSYGNGVFTAVSVGTIVLAAAAYDGSNVASLGTINSGDKVRFNPLSLGSAQNWTVTVEIGS